MTLAQWKERRTALIELIGDKQIVNAIMTNEMTPELLVQGCWADGFDWLLKIRNIGPKRQRTVMAAVFAELIRSGTTVADISRRFCIPDSTVRHILKTSGKGLLRNQTPAELRKLKNSIDRKEHCYG